MAHRPYPNRDRALRQLARGRRPEPPTDLQLRLARQANAALETAGRAVANLRRDFQLGEYRMSTR